MTKEEQIEALKEAKKWEIEQQNKVGNATGKMVMMPMLIVVVIMIVGIKFLGIKDGVFYSLIYFVAINVMFFKYSKKALEVSKEIGGGLGVTKFSVGLLGIAMNIIGVPTATFMTIMIIG